MTDTDDVTTRIISVDDHVVEPEDLWTSRAPAGRRGVVPHTIVGDDGILYWVYESMRMPISITMVGAGTDIDARTLGYVSSYDELDPGHYRAAERAALLDRDGVLASLCFPTVPRFCGQTFLDASDKDLALACLQAYND